MQTTVRDWYVIKVLDGETLVGQLLWGFVIDSDRFSAGDYVCTSMIDEIKEQHIITAKGSYYVVEGTGKTFEAYLSEVDLLRKGYSPDQITRLRSHFSKDLQ
jgi:hypothetical protein